MANNNLQTLSELFNEKVFRIPDYQRGYAWGKRQINDFWSDLNNLDKDRIHYTGMITVEKKDEHYYVIDGQQRLTTIMILLKVILDKFDNDDWIADKEKSDHVKKFLFRRTGKKGKNIKVIFGYEKDNPSNCYFKTKILNLNDSSCYSVANETLYTKNLQYAKKIFTEKINNFTKNDDEILFKKIIKQLKFNFYEIDDELDEFVTFETMNNRGKPLTTLELLKNRLIYLTTLLKCYDQEEINGLRKDINNSWKTIYEYLGKNPNKVINDDKFLKDHWIMYFTYNRDKANVEKDFLLNEYFTQQKVLNNSLECSDITNYVLNIQKTVIEYFYIENPDKSPYDEEVKKWLSKLNRVGFGAFKPIIMAVLVEKVDKDKILEILKLAEIYIFLVFTVSNRRADTGNHRIYSYANKYFQDKNIDNLLKNIKKELYSDENRYRWVDLKAFENMINNHFKDDKGWYSWKGIKYLLYEYELYLQEKVKGTVKLQWEEINKDTIEHIYPQTPKDECWTNKFSSLKKKEKYRYLHSLGNLVLLSNSKNSSLKNNCFNKKNYNKKNKRDAFSNGSYSEIEVSKYTQWTPLEIKERGEKILQFLSNRWNIKIGQNIILNIL